MDETKRIVVVFLNFKRYVRENHGGYMRKLLIAFLSLAMTSCTLSIIQTDTHGQATDVVDSTPSTTAETQADISIPAKVV